MYKDPVTSTDKNTFDLINSLVKRLFHDEAFPSIRLARRWDHLGNLQYRATLMGHPDPTSWRHAPLVAIQEGNSRGEVLLMLLEAVEELSWGKMEETNDCEEEMEEEQMMGELAMTFDKVMKH